MKIGDKVTFLGMPAEVVRVTCTFVTYHLGAEKVEITVRRQREVDDRSPSRAAPGV